MRFYIIPNSNERKVIFGNLVKNGKPLPKLKPRDWKVAAFVLEWKKYDRTKICKIFSISKLDNQFLLKFDQRIHEGFCDRIKCRRNDIVLKIAKFLIVGSPKFISERTDADTLDLNWTCPENLPNKSCLKKQSCKLFFYQKRVR